MGKIQTDSNGGKFIDLGTFANLKGEQTKGGAGYIALEPGQALTDLKYVGTRTVKTQDGEVESHTVEHDGGEKGLPLGAILNNQLSELKVKKGDVFALARLPDVEKKKGKGKGRMMKVYKVIVTKRAK